MKKLSKKLTFLLPIFYFLILSLVLIFSWFRDGFIYGGGDVGLQTLNPQRTLENARYIWWEAISPGTPIPQGLTSLPFHFVFSKLQLIGFSSFMIQPSLFFILIFAMGYGMYRLILFIFNDKFKKYAIVAGFFYVLNPYMMIQVWHRFVHSTFFLAAALPFFIIFWLKWIREGKIKHLLFFLVVNLLATYLYGTIAYIITIWTLLFLITISEIILPWHNLKLFKRILFKFILGFFFWVLTNIWWMLPTFTVGPAIFSTQHSSEESLFTLINIGRQSIIPYSLQFINPFYLFYQAEFGESYKNLYFRLIPFLYVSLILFGLIKSLKQTYLARWAFIFLIALFLAKGAASPLSYPYIFGFQKIFALGVLRNPFEKIGILLPILGSIVFVFGLFSFRQFLLRSVKILYVNLVTAVLLILIFSFSWPMFIYQPFGKPNDPGYVKVPESYGEADKWIKSDIGGKERENPAKILHLPLALGEGVSYKWEHGYSGLESSDLLFTSLPSISHGFNIDRLDDSLTALSLMFFKPLNISSEKILQILGDFNVKYIVLHKDVNWLGGDLYDPIQAEDLLNNLYFLNHVQSFGDLSIYKVADEYFRPKITLSNNFQLVYPSDTGKFWPWLIGNDQSMITPVNNQIDGDLIDQANRIIVFPKQSFINPKTTFIKQIVNQITTDEGTIKLLLSQNIRAKPILTQNGEIQSEELNNKIISTTEKIVNILKSKDTKDSSLIENYGAELNSIFSSGLRDSRLLLYVNEKDISLIFQIHMAVLATLKETADTQNKSQLENTYKLLQDQLIKNNFMPQYPINLENTELVDSQKVFKYQIPKSANYEILMTNPISNLEDFNFTVNGKLEKKSSQIKDDFLSFGEFNFDSDFWELGFDIIPSANLILPFDKLVKYGNVSLAEDVIKIETEGQFGYIESSISSAKGGDIYRISFDLLPSSLRGFYFQLVQDNDNVDKAGQRSFQLNEFVDLASSANNWQNFRFTLLPLRLTTQQAAIRLIAVSNGQTIPPGSMSVKNFRLEKLLSSDLVLNNVNNESKKDFGNRVLNIERKSPVLYQGKIEIFDPAFFIFSETFHPDWKLKLTDSKNTYEPEKHYMANLYANAWFLENRGEYNFELVFEPQRIVDYGMIAAALSYLTLAILTLWNKFKNENK